MPIHSPLVRSAHSGSSSAPSSPPWIVKSGSKVASAASCDAPVEIEASRWCGSGGKRLFDVLASGIALIPLLPVFFCIGALVRYTSEGPAIFKQQRVGQHGLPFTIFKFRTMRQGIPGSSRSSHRDSRLTKVGRFLRRYKLDELPQLVNVLRGDMSLVGPRPKLDDHHLVDFCYRPGITGAATLAFAGEERLLLAIPEDQLERCHQKLICPKKLQLDSDYMAKATFSSDLLMIMNTLLRRGRYTSLSQLGTWSVAQKAQPEVVSTAYLPRATPSNLRHLDWVAGGAAAESPQEIL
jgi:lipopolysaccharide/colanic/teichoic acid biosynthesis glycosyltransferase